MTADKPNTTANIPDKLMCFINCLGSVFLYLKYWVTATKIKATIVNGTIHKL